MIENKIKKLQKFQSKPTSMTATNINAESARVLKTALLRAMRKIKKSTWFINEEIY